MARRRKKGLEGRTCLVGGCGRKVRPGRVVCVDCRRTGRGRDLERAVGRLAEELGRAAERPEDQAERAAEVRAAVRRLAMSEEGAVVAERVAELAAEARSERVLGEDLGLLRAAMGRAILEEEDAVRAATEVTGLAKVAVELVRVQAAVGKGRKR